MRRVMLIGPDKQAVVEVEEIEYMELRRVFEESAGTLGTPEGLEWVRKLKSREPIEVVDLRVRV